METIRYYFIKYSQKMKGSTYSTMKGWVKGIKELTIKQKRSLIKQLENKYFDYPGAKR